MLELADATLFPRADSLDFGVNIPGKQRETLAFAAGLPTYMAKCRESAERGRKGLRSVEVSPFRPRLDRHFQSAVASCSAFRTDRMRETHGLGSA